MKRHFQPIETPLGIAKGRDAIYLDEVIFKDRTNTIVLVGSFNTALCSNPNKTGIDFSGFRITFHAVLAVEILELDCWDWESESSFDEIINSDWIRSLKGKVSEKNRHFLVQTYDDVIEVVCESYTIEMTETEPSGSANLASLGG
jgi:hypothetical protein